MSCQKLGECPPYFCLAGRVRTFFFLVLGHCLRFGVGPRKKEDGKGGY